MAARPVQYMATQPGELWFIIYRHGPKEYIYMYLCQLHTRTHTLYTLHTHMYIVKFSCPTYFCKHVLCSYAHVHSTCICNTIYNTEAALFIITQKAIIIARYVHIQCMWINIQTPYKLLTLSLNSRYTKNFPLFQYKRLYYSGIRREYAGTMNYIYTCTCIYMRTGWLSF